MPAEPARVCHFCSLPIAVDDEAMQSKCRTALAHFECWYEGDAFHPEKRDPTSGKLVNCAR